MSYSVILYYKYVRVPDPQTEHTAHRQLCQRLGLRGRILLATEGINGTVAGEDAAIDAYIALMNAHPQFGGIAYKRDNATRIPFPRLRIKVRPEIVTLGADVDPAAAAPKLTPRELHELIGQPGVILFDARNDYESAIGRFDKAIAPGIKLFKDLPAALNDYDHLKDQTVVTYCTGGIRCEKASALMKQKGFAKVFALEGGIVEYAKAYPDGAFKGECFVFDDRMSVAFTDNPQLLGHCRLCGASSNTYRNCANPECNDLMIVCAKCHDAGMRRCLSCAPSTQRVTA